ncbi:hypothetical protein ACTFIZ_000986 [Dictyostelium cf. discoideum]
MSKIISIYLLLCLLFIYKIVSSDLNVIGGDFKNQYPNLADQCVFEKSLVVSHPDEVFNIIWGRVETEAIGISFHLVKSFRINDTTIFQTVLFQIDGIGVANFYVNASTGKYPNLIPVISQIFNVQCYAAKVFRFEPISKYFYNFYDLTYSVYIKIIGIDDNSDPPQLIPENPEIFWMEISNDFGKFKLTMKGVPDNFTPLLFFYDHTLSFKYNITSPYKNNISYKDSIIDRKSPDDYQMIHKFDYPQYWIKLKPQERYPYLFLTNSIFPSPKLVSSDDDGSYNYFCNLRPINSAELFSQYYPTLILQNFTNLFNISDHFEYSSFDIYPQRKIFSESLQPNRNKLIQVEYTGYNVSNRVEIQYSWSSISFIPFPFGYGGGNNSEFQLDLTILTATNLSSSRYSHGYLFSIGKEDVTSVSGDSGIC